MIPGVREEAITAAEAAQRDAKDHLNDLRRLRALGVLIGTGVLSADEADVIESYGQSRQDTVPEDVQALLEKCERIANAIDEILEERMRASLRYSTALFAATRLRRRDE